MSEFQPHVLVVDDSSLMRRQLVAEFSGLSVTTVEAANGFEAIREIHKRKPDLITLDVEMPKLDGYGVCKLLSADAATLGIPVIMVSANPSDEERWRALEAGALEYFVKPFEPGSLRRLAQTLLGRVQLNRTKRIWSVVAEPELRTQLEASLSRNGYQHRSFDEPEALLEVLSKEPCNVLLIDFRLTERSAYRVLDALRRMSDAPDIKVIALASHEARRDLVNAYYAGASDFVRIPFFSEELLARVEHQLHVQSEEIELRDLATVDALTRVANRGELVRRAGVEIGRALREETPLGVLVVDIDHFKGINDRFGHAFGDEVLRRVARELQERIRETDFIGRYGGEEFVVLLPGSQRSNLKIVAERLRCAIECLRLEHAGELVPITTSLGGQSWLPGDLSPQLGFDRLIQASDRALYAAKAGGRNRWVVEDSD